MTPSDFIHDEENTRRWNKAADVRPASGPGQRWRLGVMASLLGMLVGLQGGVIKNPGGPPVSISAEPSENGDLVYMRIPPYTSLGAGGSLLGLRVRVENHGAEQLHWTKIRVSFPDNPALNQDFDRDILINANKSKSSYLSPEEAIGLPQVPPPTANILCFFEGYPQAASIQRDLVPYQSPTGFYLFPGKGSDLGVDEYFSNKAQHTGGSQFFGYDLVVHGWDSDAGKYRTVKPGGDSNLNEDRRGWGIPIHAMADGTVVRARTGFEDNPHPGTRVIQRMADDVADSISDVKVTRLTATRAVSVARKASGQLQLIVWDVQDFGCIVTRRGSTEAETVQVIATDALSSTKLVTAVRTATGKLRVILWNISTDGDTITRLDDKDAAGVEEVSLARLSSSDFATAVRTDEGVLRLIVWQVSGNSLILKNHAFAGEASSISTVALSSTRLVTALRTAGGALKSIVWDVLDGGATIDRLGDATGGAIDQVVATRNSSTHFITAVRANTGELKLTRWEVSEDGLTVNSGMTGEAGQIQSLAMAPAFSGSVATAVITQAGNYKNILWSPDEDLNVIKRIGEASAGSTDALDVEQVDTSVLLSGVRTASGELKVIAWWLGSGGGNSLWILHGNALVLYAHFRLGSVDPSIAYPGAPVAAGQFLARMGNSGSSSGPHTHIHASRVPDGMTANEVIEVMKAEGHGAFPYRPIPFHGAKTMKLDFIAPGGLGNPANHFSTMWGQGPYFARFGIRPIWVPLPPPPVLGYQLKKAGLELSWGSNLYSLQYKDELSQQDWMPYPFRSSSPVMVPPSEAGNFFRLHRRPSTLDDFGLGYDLVWPGGLTTKD